MHVIASNVVNKNIIYMKEEDNKWKVRTKIKDFRNLKNIDFEFIRGGITIIVGENNIGKTNLLDYMYEENEQWDKFETNDYEKEFFQEIRQWLPNCRKNTSLLDLFSPNSFFSSYPTYFRLKPDQPIINVIKNILHHSNPAYKKKETEGSITLSYKIYYFDLSTSTSFLSKKGKEGFKMEKVKSRSCKLLYGKENEKGRYHEHFTREVDEDKPTETSSWIPSYRLEDNFIRHEEEGIITYRGFNKNICHSLDKIGSGYLKYKTLESLVDNIGRGHSIKRGTVTTRPCFPVEAQSTILLIDEPEIFLHPSLLSRLANLIKKAAENDITVILTTHSPNFLLHFVDDLLDEEDKTNLVITQKDEDDLNLKSPLYFRNFIRGDADIDGKDDIGNIEKRIKKAYEGFAAEKKEDINDDKFYASKWKRLFNRETLRIFFSKNVLFVEGMSDYIMFNDILREELRKEMTNVEIIPIFGKSHYSFFNELAKKLNLNYWFLLDDDRGLDEKGNLKENKEISENEKFWRKYGEGKINNKKGGILHSNKLVANIEMISGSTEKEIRQRTKKQISEFLKKNKIKSADLNSSLWMDGTTWQEHIKKLESKKEFIEFVKTIEKESSSKISWFRSDIETFLFGEKVKRNKEYELINRADEVLTNLKKDNSAKLKELKKVFGFLKSSKLANN